MTMKMLLRLGLVVLLVAGLGSGCRMRAKSGRSDSYVNESALGMAAGDSTLAIAPADRMLAWSAEMTLAVTNLTNAASTIVGQVKQAGGYVEKNEVSYGVGRLALRVPTATLESTMAALGGLGEVTSRSVAAEDLTDSYVDVDARLKSKQELRERLGGLLGRATNVTEMLAIETELNRVQADIESMTARLQTMQQQVAMATLAVTLHQKGEEPKKPIPGPLGLVIKSVAWVIEKLFWIRR